MTLYIYRVGWTYPGRNPITRSKSIKIPSCTRNPLGPVRPVGCCRTDYGVWPVRPLGRTGQTARAYRSDRSVLSNANFSHQFLYRLYIYARNWNLLYQYVVSCFPWTYAIQNNNLYQLIWTHVLPSMATFWKSAPFKIMYVSQMALRVKRIVQKGEVWQISLAGVIFIYSLLYSYDQI